MVRRQLRPHRDRQRSRGFIKPALPGFTDMDNMADLQDRLEERYGAENAEKISSGNALRMLRYRFN